MSDLEVTQYHSSEAFPPGEFLGELLEEHGLYPSDLARELGWSERRMARVLEGEERISASMARGLSRVLGTTPESWLALERGYWEYLRQRSAKRSCSEFPSLRPNCRARRR